MPLIINLKHSEITSISNCKDDETTTSESEANAQEDLVGDAQNPNALAAKRVASKLINHQPVKSQNPRDYNPNRSFKFTTF